VEYWKDLTGDRVGYSPFHEVAERFPNVSHQQFRSAVQLILPDGDVRSGADAVFTMLATLPGRRWMLWSYERLPGVAALCETTYRTIAAHRSAAYQVTRLLWGIPVRRETYQVTGWLFCVCWARFISRHFYRSERSRRSDWVVGHFACRSVSERRAAAEKRASGDWWKRCTFTHTGPKGPSTFALSSQLFPVAACVRLSWGMCPWMGLGRTA
jgi:predicted DCC family thiol-disulfide oxidoreductase YuxK